MQITSGQQYNVGEKPTVILYIYINRHAGTDTRKTLKTNQGQCSTPSHMVVVIYITKAIVQRPEQTPLLYFPAGDQTLTP